MKTLTLSLLLACASGAAPQAFAADHPALTGCHQVARGEFEDGASYYRAVSEKILAPLARDASTQALGRFLESAIVTQGNLTVSPAVCENLRAALAARY